MFPIILGTFVISRTAIGMCASGIIVFLLGLWSLKNDIVKARGLEKIVALANLCFAIPLAVFGALHLFAPQFIIPIVPPYMPWRMFWVYFIGCALIAASLSIVTKVGVRWSGLLFGVMMFLFVAMIHFPGGYANRTIELFGLSCSGRCRLEVRDGFLRETQSTHGLAEPRRH